MDDIVWALLGAYFIFIIALIIRTAKDDGTGFAISAKKILFGLKDYAGNIHVVFLQDERNGIQFFGLGKNFDTQTKIWQGGWYDYRDLGELLIDAKEILMAERVVRMTEDGDVIRTPLSRTP